MIFQLVFIGHHGARIIESIRKSGEMVDKIVLVTGDDKTIEGEEICWKTAEGLRKELLHVWDVEILRINKIDVLLAMQQLLAWTKERVASGHRVIINASGSMHTLALAGYFVSCLVGCRFFTALPRYTPDGEDVGVDRIIDVPRLPISLPGSEQLEILRAIDGGVDSLDALVSRIRPSLQKKTSEFRNERSRVSHHISKLESIGFISREKRGKNVRISLTDLGKSVQGIET